jgi:hypothetical protein
MSTKEDGTNILAHTLRNSPQGGAISIGVAVDVSVQSTPRQGVEEVAEGVGLQSDSKPGGAPTVGVAVGDAAMRFELGAGGMMLAVVFICGGGG